MNLDSLHHCDCLVGLSDLLSEGCVDFVFADLPYGETQNDWDKRVPTEALWPLLRRVCKPNAVMVFTAVQPFASLLVASNLDEFRYEMIWKKNKSGGFLNAKKQPLRIHENVLVFYRESPAYEFEAVKTSGHRPMNAATKKPSRSPCYGNYGPSSSEQGTTLRHATTVLDIPVVNNDDPERIHPTQKPVALVEWFLRAYTQPGDLVLDPTAGSGTTLVAAKNLGRRYVGFEDDSVMVARAKRRLARTGMLTACGQAVGGGNCACFEGERCCCPCHGKRR